jgi:peptide-methionine (R)-S-oxide reductase
MPLSPAGYDVTRLDASTIQELAKSLSPEERHVILSAGTERPFCGTLLDNKKEGTYVCRLCGLPLFRSKAKFDSGTGWPSFYEPYAKEHIEYREDLSHGMVRTEINCQRCGGHLGHVFDDGPRPTGQRYCLNSASLEFYETGAPLPQRVDADRGPAKSA